MKQNITRAVAQCSQCHRALPSDEMTGYICDSCMDALRDIEEPSKVAWEDVSDD